MPVAWDPARPVPWQRLIREWLIYVAIMAVIFVALFRDRNLVGIFSGLLASGPIYMAFGYALAKLGYQRKTLKQLRSATPADRDPTEQHRSDGPRPKPAPTSRTGGGARRSSGSRNKRRR